MIQWVIGTKGFHTEHLAANLPVELEADSDLAALGPGLVPVGCTQDDYVEDTLFLMIGKSIGKLFGLHLWVGLMEEGLHDVFLCRGGNCIVT